MVLVKSSTLSSKFSQHRADIFLFDSALVLLHSTGLGMPLLVILELTLHLIEVHVEVVSVGTSGSEVSVHAGVKATSQADTGFILGVIEFFVEVGDVSGFETARLHAVLKHYASSSFLV